MFQSLRTTKIKKTVSKVASHSHDISHIWVHTQAMYSQEHSDTLREEIQRMHKSDYPVKGSSMMSALIQVHVNFESLQRE